MTCVVSVRFEGRKANAIGITYAIPGAYRGEGDTWPAAIDAARRAAYDAGWAHLTAMEVIREGSTDPTEDARRALIAAGDPEIPPDAMTTEAMCALYDVIGFAAPFVVVTRKSDGVKGSLRFTHWPRRYFGFVAG
jgi:hypothetical protein